MKRDFRYFLLLINMIFIFIYMAGCAVTGVERDNFYDTDDEIAGYPQEEYIESTAPESLDYEEASMPYKPPTDYHRVFYGKASYYGNEFVGRTTASGEKYDPEKLTAAHLSLPFGTICKVTNLANGKSVTVRITDRGPYVAGRVLDLSYLAARLLEGIRPGVIDVRVEVLELGK